MKSWRLRYYSDMVAPSGGDLDLDCYPAFRLLPLAYYVFPAFRYRSYSLLWLLDRDLDFSSDSASVSNGC